jgi:hypothetical protein
LGTLIYEEVKLQREGKIGLNQSLIYIHPFSPTLTPIFYLPLCNSVAKRKLVFGRKKHWGGMPPFSPSSYAYDPSLYGDSFTNITTPPPLPTTTTNEFSAINRHRRRRDKGTTNMKYSNKQAMNSLS